MKCVYGCRNTNKEGDFLKIEKIRIHHHGRIVHGLKYLPEGEKKWPMVIFSHGYNGSKMDFVPTAEWLAGQGIGSFCYTFCGGSKMDESKYPTTKMTIFSEKEDLLAVFDAVCGWETTEKENIFVFGGSQGGLVTALAAEERKDKVKGMILLYPALCIADDWNTRFHNESDIPDELEVWGMNLGRIFFESLRGFDPFEHIGTYDGPVLIMHGNQDQVVPLETSRRAGTLYANVEMKLFSGEGHGFSEQGTKRMEQELLEFLKKHIT